MVPKPAECKRNGCTNPPAIKDECDPHYWNDPPDSAYTMSRVKLNDCPGCQEPVFRDEAKGQIDITRSAAFWHSACLNVGQPR